MIHLLGSLGRKYGRKIDIKGVKSPAEAIRALSVNLKGFKKDIKKNGHYAILCGDQFKKDKCVGITEDEMTWEFSKDNWFIVPIPAGAGGGSWWFPVLIGIVLIAAAVFMPASIGIVGGLAISAGQVGMLGIGFVALGLSMYFSPAMEAGDYGNKESADERPSYLSDGPRNTVETGTPVGLVYGRDVWVGSKVISAGADIVDITI